MALARPELIFVAGPQQGERAVIMTDVAMAGRAPSADLHLVDEFASRRHMQLELTPDGCVLENLSANGTVINGKRYKAGKKVVLATGDVLGVGLETQILYVAPGDDPDGALAAYRQAHPIAPTPAPEPTAPPADSSGPTARRGWFARPAADDDAQPTGTPPADKPTRTKLKKYGLLIGIYAAGLIVLVVALSTLKKESATDMAGGPARLTDQQLAEAVMAHLERPPNSTAAAEALGNALNYYRDRALRTGNLYRCVKNFKLHLAFKPSPGFEDVRNDRRFSEAGNELTELVQQQYRNAYALEQKRDWRRANDAFQRVLRIVPEHDQQDPAYTGVVRNVTKHVAFVSRHKGRRK